MDPTAFFHGHQLEIARSIDVGDTDSLQSLVFGAPLNEPGAEGMTLLIYALGRRQKAAMRILLSSGADPNAVSPAGISAMLLAAGADDPELLGILLNGKGDPCLCDPDGAPLTFTAANQRRWRNLKLLLDRGASINAKDPLGNTLIHRLAMRNDFQSVAVLLKVGADAGIANLHGVRLADLVRASRAAEHTEAGRWRLEVAKMLNCSPSEL